MLASEYCDRSERLEAGKRIFTDAIALKPIAYRKDGSLRRATNLLTASSDAAMIRGCARRRW